MTRLLAVLGSGETAPTMIKPHRQLFEAAGPGPAVLLDTPYGFQANADDISARAVEYFRASVGRTVEVASLRRATDDPVRRQEALARVGAAVWVFAGPGSPTYALRQWRPTDLPALLSDKLTHGGCLVFASAAALTLGRCTVPVYEIYKVGADPEWAEGLGLIDFLGPEVAVIPHYDNAEGGSHDTRFCYLGEARLSRLEAQMGPDGWVLGVDEHTGAVFDLDAGTMSVVGNGTVTVRRQGSSSEISSGEVLDLAEVVEMARTAGSPPGQARSSPPGPPSPPDARAGPPGGSGGPTSLVGEVRRLELGFDRAVEEPDVEAAVRAALELEDALVAWSSDTTQSDAADRGRAALQRMIVRLGDLARQATGDPRQHVGGFVAALLAERAAARAAGRYHDADRIRAALTGHGIEVRDTPGGTEWELI